MNARVPKAANFRSRVRESFTAKLIRAARSKSSRTSCSKRLTSLLVCSPCIVTQRVAPPAAQRIAYGGDGFRVEYALRALLGRRLCSEPETEMIAS